MKYLFETWKVSKLIELMSKGNLNLKPHYQRNSIWSKKDKNLLIDSIYFGYPLPSFFLYSKNDKEYEVVDGQQRITTMLEFNIGEITGSDLKSIKNTNSNTFLDYQINVTIIKDIENSSDLVNFYTLVNKSGKHLNANELNKAQFNNTPFLKMVEKIAESKEFCELDIFTDSTRKRMNDRALIEELVAIIKYDEVDKRGVVTKLFEGIEQPEADELYNKFMKITQKVLILNKEYPIKKTRYRQRNDFYTLFQFIYKNIGNDIELLKYQYKVLRVLAPHIRPSQEECDLLQEYALNCVSQSNSKDARQKRLQIFDMLLKPNINDPVVLDVIDYLEDSSEIELDQHFIKIKDQEQINIKEFDIDE
ncbi:DUF262 domain-containing protein [Flammeovirga sp. SJP92]|uniref:DUF262 domain-containing protein n=1 Tax=Flammeovirga sp. SJP92 TaxID=1775430 RepID=UPI00078962AC|nr:DUF262 domain-containing protein [Flammeovirga sp. SJP92]KXX66640.1 hypothetical protein AVL50_30830 [Flammeovirga sp. SJP92]